MMYQQPPAPTLPPQPSPPMDARDRRGLFLTLVVVATLALTAVVVSTVPAALTNARSAAYPRPSLGDISYSGGVSNHIPINQPVQFSVQINAGHDLSYVWNFGDGTSSNDASPTHTYSTYAGTAQVSVTVFDPIGQEADQTTQVAMLPPPPTAVITVDYAGCSAPATDCLVSADAASSSSEEPGISLTATWNWGDGAIDMTAINDLAQHQYPNQSATYTITLTVTDPYGQTGTAQQTVSF